MTLSAGSADDKSCYRTPTGWELIGGRPSGFFFAVRPRYGIIGKRLHSDARRLLSLRSQDKLDAQVTEHFKRVHVIDLKLLAEIRNGNLLPDIGIMNFLRHNG